MKNLVSLAGVSRKACVLILLMVAPIVSQAQSVATIGISEVVYSANNLGESSTQIVDEIGGALTASLNQTRKFRVLNRAALRQRLEKNGITLDSLYNVEDKRSAYFQGGLDYVLAANVVEYSCANPANIKIKFRLVGVTDATEDFTSEVVALGSSEPVLDGSEVIDKAVAKMIEKVVSTVHPLRVMKIADDATVTLNYGDGYLQTGDLVAVYAIDQDLAANAQDQVQPIATLKVVSSDRKFAHAQAVAGYTELQKRQKARLILSDD